MNSTTLAILISIATLLSTAAAHAADSITPNTEFDAKGRVRRQYFTYTKTGAKPVVIEHGLDLPTFTDPESYGSDIERYRRDAYNLRMLNLGVTYGVIKEVPNDLKGDKFREWMKNEAIKVENSLCSNSALRNEMMSLFKNAMEVPPPPKNDDFDRFSVPPEAKPVPKNRNTTL